MKNISLFVAALLMTVTISLLASVNHKKSAKPTVLPVGEASESKSKIDKAKGNPIMLRFIS